MINPRFFPTVMIVLSIMSAVAYAINGDARKSIYWIAAATLNLVVTY